MYGAARSRGVVAKEDGLMKLYHRWEGARRPLWLMNGGVNLPRVQRAPDSAAPFRGIALRHDTSPSCLLGVNTRRLAAGNVWLVLLWGPP
jgi:hypothetical protein